MEFRFEVMKVLLSELVSCNVMNFTPENVQTPGSWHGLAASEYDIFCSGFVIVEDVPWLVFDSFLLPPLDSVVLLSWGLVMGVGCMVFGVLVFGVRFGCFGMGFLC